MTKDKEDLQLFSQKQVLLTAIISGPLSTGYVLARNFENLNRTKAARISKITGYALLFGLYIMLEVLIENFYRATDMNISRFMAFSMVISIFVSVQALLGALFYFTINKLKSFQNLYTNTHSKYEANSLWPLILLGIGSSITLISLQAFLFIFIIVIFLPALYIFNHLKNLFKKGLGRNIFGVLYFLFAFLFPISQVLIKYFPLDFFNSLIKLGYLFMPFELYAFIGFILFDIVTLINRSTRLFSVHHKSFPKVERISKAIILCAIFLAVLFGNQNFNNTQISSYNISIPKKESEIKQLRIAFAADFHLAEITNKSFMLEFVEKMNDLKPDIILLGGDIFESYKQNPKMDFNIGQMNKIRAKYGVYGIAGNHEYYGNYEKKIEFCRKSGISMLLDSAIVVDNSFILAGRKDRHVKTRETIEKILETTNKNLPVILMDHRPDEFKSAYNNHVDIQFSGHTHNGQLFPYNFITEALYDLSWGYKKINGTNFFVTCGVQGWGPQVRTTGYSEIMLIDVKFE